jgi:hypothetical protein
MDAAFLTALFMYVLAAVLAGGVVLLVFTSAR